ncbi:AGAP011506-PA-like protein [Anopheles sinensis]|uniref:AGAP011506-PA-like protein n=1 Tax=Anopheles sinensis TaxID=74873 RepID=A0A084VSA9_ANOSI|nr:AGAP011506-PA-like protein [Anopheles sinensis]
MVPNVSSTFVSEKRLVVCGVVVLHCPVAFLLQLLPTLTIFLLTVALVSAGNDDFNIELKQKDAEVYHEQSFGRNEFNYGYQVEKTNSQFQHKAKGPDDVTYGCYGYIDPDGEKHLVYYIADRLGYRLLAPDQPTKVFTDRVANSVNKLDADLQGRKLDEKVVAWNDLYLPSTCRRLNEIVSITPPPTPVVVPVTTSRNGAGLVIDPITPIGPQDPKEPTTERPSIGNGNGLFNGATSEPNLGGDNSGTGNVQVPIVDESNQGKLKNEGGVPTTETPQIPSNNGFGVSEAPGDESGNFLKKPRVPPNNGVEGGIGGVNGGGVPSSPVDLPRNDNFGTPQKPTQRPVRQEVTRTPRPPTPEPTPAPQQIDPIVPLPGTTYPQPGVVETHHPQCGQQPPTTGPFRPGPKYPASIGQFNGFVFPINRDCDASGRSTADLLAQMQAINELVLKVSSTLHEQTGGAADRNATCQRVLELLNVQQPVPLLVYVPIMIPYLDGGIQAGAGAQKPPINPASYAYAKSCSDCK